MALSRPGPPSWTGPTRIRHPAAGRGQAGRALGRARRRPSGCHWATPTRSSWPRSRTRPGTTGASPSTTSPSVGTCVTHREVDPRRVVAEDGHWYLFGCCHLAGTPRDRSGSTASRPSRRPTVARSTPTDRRTGPGSTSRPPTAPWNWWWHRRTPGWRTCIPTVESEVLADGRMRIVLQVTATPWLERLLLRLGPDATGRDLDDGRDLAGLAARAAGRCPEPVHRCRSGPDRSPSSLRHGMTDPTPGEPSAPPRRSGTGAPPTVVHPQRDRVGRRGRRRRASWPC